MLKRRAFLPALIGVFSGLGAFLTPTPLFAAKVRHSRTRLNGNMVPHIERRATAHMPYAALEDSAAFHELAENCRLAMIEQLRSEGAPINVWRVGMIGGIVGSRIDARTGLEQEWKDEHHFYVRTRASVEHEPRQYIEGVDVLPRKVLSVKELPDGRLVVV